MHVLAYVRAVAGKRDAVGTGRLEPTGKIGRVAVLPQYRGTGAGVAIMRRLMELAAERGFTEVYLNAQTSASGILRAAGFPGRRPGIRRGRDTAPAHAPCGREWMGWTTGRTRRGHGASCRISMSTAAAVAEIATRARRTLSIYTPDLEPQIYDHDLFLEPVKRLVLARSHARLRVLISDPGRAVREGNRFMMMARRLTSYIDLRNVAQRIPQQPLLVHHRRRQGHRVPPAVLALGRHRRVRRHRHRQALPRVLRRGLGRQPDPAGNARHGDRLLIDVRQAAVAP